MIEMIEEPPMTKRIEMKEKDLDPKTSKRRKTGTIIPKRTSLSLLKKMKLEFPETLRLAQIDLMDRRKTSKYF